MTTSLSADMEKRAQSSTTMTSEERSILAWERIADELRLLNQSIEQLLHARGAASDGQGAADVGDCKS